MTKHLLLDLLPVTTCLQAKLCDLVEAVKEAVTVITQLQQERADPEVWNILYEGAMELTAKFEVQQSKARGMGCWKTKTPSTTK